MGLLATTAAAAFGSNTACSASNVAVAASNVAVAANIAAASASNVAYALPAQLATLSNSVFPAIAVVAVAAAAATGSGGSRATAIAFSNATLGTEAAPVNGGTVNLDVSATPNAVIQLSSNVPSGNLVLNLYNGATQAWTNSLVGTSGNVVIVERSPLGRGLTVDGRLNFPAPLTSPFQTTAAYSNAYSVDTLGYFIPTSTFGFASYTRQFKTVAPGTVLKWLARIGGTGTDSLLGLSAAPDGGFYATGFFNSASLTFYGASNVAGTVGGTGDFGTQLVDANAASTSYSDGFLAKYNAQGAAQWVAQLGNSASGSTGSFQGFATAPSSDGGVFAVGTFTGTFVAYSAGGTAYATRQPANAGGTDVFVIKYSSTGTVSWVGNLSSVAADQSPSVTGTSDGGCVVACAYGGALVCYDSGGNSTTLAFAGTTDVAVVKYDVAGKLTVNGGTGWLARVGNAGVVSGGGVTAGGLGLCTGPDGGVYVAGAYNTGPLTVYDKTLTAYATTLPKSAGASDGFVVKFTSAGAIALTSTSNPWFTHVGVASGYAAFVSSLAVASDGGLIACGGHGGALSTYSTANNATADVLQPANASAGTYDAFVIKYTSDGVKSWVTTLRGASNDVATAVACCADGGIVTAGFYASASLTVYAGATQSPYGTVLANAGGNDTFVAKLNVADGTVAWLTRFAGAADDAANAMAVLGDGGVVVGGTTLSQPMYVYDRLGVQYGLTFSPSLYQFTTYTFTNAGSTGTTGPLIASVRSAYSGATWAQNASYLSMTTQGIQLWTVPATGTYSITVGGASGGSANGNIGGYGRIVTASFIFQSGDILRILVGQAGGSEATYGAILFAGGGGGGTFVANNANTLLIAGGGGGGAGTGYTGTSIAGPGLNGSATIYGLLPGNTPGATGGLGGIVDPAMVGNAGGAGGGFSTNGVNGAGFGGASYLNGGNGGLESGPLQGGNGDGGFGGGGGVYNSGGGLRGGGGGGYSGGSGGWAGSVVADKPMGGGGGSYWSTSLAMSASYGSTNSGAGFVTIAMVGPDAYIVKMDPSGLMT
jgi:hypothetical protein